MHTHTPTAQHSLGAQPKPNTQNEQSDLFLPTFDLCAPIKTYIAFPIVLWLLRVWRSNYTSGAIWYVSFISEHTKKRVCIIFGLSPGSGQSYRQSIVRFLCWDPFSIFLSHIGGTRSILIDVEEFDLDQHRREGNTIFVMVMSLWSLEDKKISLRDIFGGSASVWLFLCLRQWGGNYLIDRRASYFATQLTWNVFLIDNKLWFYKSEWFVKIN